MNEPLQPRNFFRFLRKRCSSYNSLSFLLIVRFILICNLSCWNFVSDISLTFYFLMGAVRFTFFTFFTAGLEVGAGSFTTVAFFTTGLVLDDAPSVLRDGLTTFLLAWILCCLLSLSRFPETFCVLDSRFFLLCFCSGFKQRHFHSTASFKNHSKLIEKPSWTMMLSRTQGYGSFGFLNSIL